MRYSSCDYRDSMSQIFHHSTNTISKFSIFGFIFIIGGLTWVGAGINRSFFAEARLRMPTRKATVTMRVDAGALNWFKIMGKGYQSRMNAVLRMYVEAQKQ